MDIIILITAGTTAGIIAILTMAMEATAIPTVITVMVVVTTVMVVATTGVPIPTADIMGLTSAIVELPDIMEATQDPTLHRARVGFPAALVVAQVLPRFLMAAVAMVAAVMVVGTGNARPSWRLG